MDQYKATGVSAQVLELQRYDAILGKPWLYNANPNINWRSNTLTFQYGKRTINIKADSQKTDTIFECSSVYISRHQLATVDKTAELFAVCTTTLLDPTNALNKDGKLLVNEFADVFPIELPNELPPKRTIDHAIELLPGSEPPSRPTYRMSYVEMDELKK